MVMRYYFDMQDGDQLIVDDEGQECASIERVQEEAARSLADMARDRALTHAHDAVRHSMSIRVRDEKGPILKAQFVFEMGRMNN